MMTNYIGFWSTHDASLLLNNLSTFSTPLCCHYWQSSVLSWHLTDADMFTADIVCWLHCWQCWQWCLAVVTVVVMLTVIPPTTLWRNLLVTWAYNPISTYTLLQCTALQCTALHCTALHCTARASELSVQNPEGDVAICVSPPVIRDNHWNC